MSRAIESVGGSVWLSLPFVAGIAAGALLKGPDGVFVLPILSAMMLVVLSKWGSGFRHAGRNFWLTGAVFFFLGILCWASHGTGDSGILDNIRRVGVRTAASIDNIPYGNPQTGGLVKALLTGDRSGLGRDLVGDFRSSGASHILALSGLHLGILYGMLRLLLKPLGGRLWARRLQYILIICSTGFYTIATGAGPSLVRAFLFIFLGETARMTGRGHSLMGIYCSAIMIQLCLNPSVITSVSFQLSYLAMAGIVLLLPLLTSWWAESDDDMQGDSLSAPELQFLEPTQKHRNPLAIKIISEIQYAFYKLIRLGRTMVETLPRKMWNIMALSISCQVFTGPVAWLYFGTFPKYFLLTNLLAMPLTLILMQVSVAVVILYPIGLCPAFLLTLNDFIAYLLIRIIHIIGTM